MSRERRLPAVGRGLLVTTVAGALVAALLSSCGLPTMKEPAAIDQVAVPTRVAQGSQSGATTVGGTAELFFVSGDHMLRAVRREGVSGSPAQVVAQTLAELVAGPDDSEMSAGLGSAFPPGLTLKLVSLSDGKAVVDIVGTDPGPAAYQAHLATGQVVLSLTALHVVDSVLFLRNGRPLEAALPDGELTALPLTEQDFSVLVQH